MTGRGRGGIHSRGTEASIWGNQCAASYTIFLRLFEREGAASWRQYSTLGDDSDVYRGIMKSVSMDRDWIALGVESVPVVPAGIPDSAKVVLSRKLIAAANFWRIHSKVDPPPDRTWHFGDAVDLQDEWLVVGDYVGGAQGAGTVDVYRYDEEQDHWGYHSTLLPTTGGGGIRHCRGPVGQRPRRRRTGRGRGSRQDLPLPAVLRRSRMGSRGNTRARRRKARPWKRTGDLG